MKAYVFVVDVSYGVVEFYTETVFAEDLDSAMVKMAEKEGMVSGWDDVDQVIEIDGQSVVTYGPKNCNAERPYPI